MFGAEGWGLEGGQGGGVDGEHGGAGGGVACGSCGAGEGDFGGEACALGVQVKCCFFGGCGLVVWGIGAGM